MELDPTALSPDKLRTVSDLFPNPEEAAILSAHEGELCKVCVGLGKAGRGGGDFVRRRGRRF